MSVLVGAREVAQDQPIDFDLRAQPLAAALARYGDITGREVFYRADLVEGRVSSPVAGRLTAPDALVKLLDGTGLQARFLDDGSFALQTVPAGIAAAQLGQASARRYYGRIQAAIRESFCRQRTPEPGTFRTVALIWIGAGGAVERVQQLSSSGSSAVDQNVQEAFLKVRLDERPPAEFAQPALIMMVPQPSGLQAVAMTSARSGRGGHERWWPDGASPCLSRPI